MIAQQTRDCARQLAVLSTNAKSSIVAIAQALESATPFWLPMQMIAKLLRRWNS